MAFSPLNRNNFINSFDVNNILNNLSFDNRAVKIIRDLGFPNFNWDITWKDALDIAPKLVRYLTNVFFKAIQKIEDQYNDVILIDEEKEEVIFKLAYSDLLAKIILNPNFDINLPDKNGVTLLSHIIFTNNIDILEFLLKNRHDTNIIQNKTQFWDTYIEFANGLGHLEVSKILEKYIQDRYS